MKRLRVLFWSLMSVLAVGTFAWGQSATSEEKPHLGYPQDWSSRYLVMPGVTESDAWRIREPRQVYNMVMRQVAMENGRRVTPPFRPPYGPIRKPTKPMKIDWSVSLENGYVPTNQFPAKYRFDVASESCSGDYVLFALTVTTGTQANVVGINNLYTEATPKCNGGTPFVSFAYNTVTHTGGQIGVSPVLSADGTKAAFIESTSTGTYFHVLVLPSPIPSPPTLPIGTVLSPQTPTSCASPTTAGCMTTLAVTNTSDSNSSPWVDYNTDTAYVGADNGMLYKITPVFKGGAPALVSDTNWPVTVSTSPNPVLTDPVYDQYPARIYLGDAWGYLYAVSSTSAKQTYSARQTIGWVTHGAGTGIVDPPIAVTDPANPTTDQVFAFTGCSYVPGKGGAVTQLPANFSSGVPDKTNTVDLGSASGNGDCTQDNLHAGTFDNQFFIRGSSGGHLIACGFVSGTSGAPLHPSNPKMYFFPFANHAITETGESTFVINSTLGDECSELTEFYDGTTDRLFFGVGGPTDAFIESSAITTSLTTPSCGGSATSSCVKAPAGGLGGTSGIIIDNQLSNGGTNIYFTTLSNGSVNNQKCKVSGGSNNPYCAVKLTQSALQ